MLLIETKICFFLRFYLLVFILFWLCVFPIGILSFNSRQLPVGNVISYSMTNTKAEALTLKKKFKLNSWFSFVSTGASELRSRNI